MNFLQYPLFLKTHDTFYYSSYKPLKIKSGNSHGNSHENYHVYKVENTTPQDHKFEYKSDFSPIFNNTVIIIEYIERDPMCINGFGMPMTIKRYSNNVNGVIGVNGVNGVNGINDDEYQICVQNNDDLPLFYSMDGNDDEEEVVVQESNVSCSVVVDNKSFCSEFEGGKMFLLTIVGNCAHVSNIQKFYISGHIQPKIEIGTKFPKQEINSLNWIRNEMYNPPNLTNHHHIQLLSVRTLRVEKEIENIRLHFKNLLGYFADENCMLNILHTMSCFPLHSPEILNILEKVEHNINMLYLSESINFFNILDSSKLGRCDFRLKFSKIFRRYFDLHELENIDNRLDKYVKEYGKKNYSEKGDYVKNINKKKMGFIDIKKKIIRLVYAFEHKYLRSISHKFDKEMFLFLLDNTILCDGYKTPIVDIFDKFEMDIDKIFSNSDSKYNYGTDAKSIKLIKDSEVFKSLHGYKKSRSRILKHESTKNTQLRYSNIFFEKSPSSLDIQRAIIKKFSNQKSVFLDYVPIINEEKKRKKKKKKKMMIDINKDINKGINKDIKKDIKKDIEKKKRRKKKKKKKRKRKRKREEEENDKKKKKKKKKRRIG